MHIPEIKARLGILEVVRHYGLKLAGTNRMVCPFHEDHTPSLHLYPKTGTFHCFGCAATGDVIEFIQRHEHLDKATALATAARLAGISTEIDRGSDAPLITELSAEARQAVLLNVYTGFCNGLRTAPDPRQWLTGRTLNHLMEEQLDAGYNSGQFHHRGNRHLIESALALGLLTPNPSGGYYVWAKHCVVLPLRNAAGQIVSLYGRSIRPPKPDGSGKHYYLRDRQGLYPRYPEPTTEVAVLTESVLDTASLMQAVPGTNTERPDGAQRLAHLALYGVNGLTAEHLTCLKHLLHLKEVVLFLDGDDAGRNAEPLLAAALWKHLRPTHPDLVVSTVDTPDGDDPNELLVKYGPEALRELLDHRHPVAAIPLFASTEPTVQTPTDVSNVAEPTEPTLFDAVAAPPAEPATPPTGAEDVLNTANPDAFIYSSRGLRITLLGGVALGGLDRLRITLKLEKEPAASAVESIRQHLDLYHDDAVAKLVRRAADRLEVPTGTVAAALGGLTEALERWRLRLIEQRAAQPGKHKPRELTDVERASALGLLQSPNLLERIGTAIGLAGVVAEENNRLLLYVLYTSRKLPKPLHAVCLGSSGAGKTHLQEQVAALMPDEDKLEITTLSENALYYFGRDDLRHKLILIEDLDGAEDVLYPLRELQSKGRLTKTVVLKDAKGHLRTTQLVVEGPVAVSGCTTREALYEDNANRSFLLHLDETPQQDNRVLANQRARAAGRVDTAAEQRTRTVLQNAQRLLQPVAVRTPFAEHLALPEAILKPRRTNAHYLACVEAIAFLHQHQRPRHTDQRTGEVYIEATLDDVRWANRLLRDVLLRKSDELTGACRAFFERLKTWLDGQDTDSFAARDVRAALRLNPNNLKRYLGELLRYGLLKVGGGSRARGFEYRIANDQEYTDLQRGVDDVLDAVLHKLEQNAANSEQRTANSDVSAPTEKPRKPRVNGHTHASTAVAAHPL